MMSEGSSFTLDRLDIRIYPNLEDGVSGGWCVGGQGQEDAITSPGCVASLPVASSRRCARARGRVAASGFAGACRRKTRLRMEENAGKPEKGVDRIERSLERAPIEGWLKSDLFHSIFLCLYIRCSPCLQIRHYEMLILSSLIRKE